MSKRKRKRKRKTDDLDVVGNEAKRDKYSIFTLRDCDSDDSSIESDEITCIKVPLAKIVLDKHRDEAIEYISKLSIKATKISALSSLLLLMKVNRAVDDDDTILFQSNANYRNIIKTCFKQVATSTIIRLLDRFEIAQPEIDAFGNVATYLIDQYTTCFKNTNSLKQARQRFWKYFRTIHRNRKAIDDTITYMLNDKSHVEPDKNLMKSLQKAGQWKEIQQRILYETATTR